MSECTLTYFTSQALGEAIRLLLSYGKVQFNDVRINHATEWSSYPKETLPMGQLPILEIDGKKLYQSIAICRYLGKKFGLSGTTVMEDYEIDNAVDNVNDFRARIASGHYESNAVAKEEKMKVIKNEAIPFFLNRLEAIAKANDGHFALKKLTWADLYFTGMINYLNSMAGSNLTENHPYLRKVVENTESTPGIKEWVAKRPQSAF